MQRPKLEVAPPNSIQRPSATKLFTNLNHRLEWHPLDTADHHNDARPVHPASLPADQLRAASEIHFTRRSGPGGQHRNKVETAVRLTHRPTGVWAEASERRRQAENLQVALRRLRLRLALNVRTPWQQPSRLWQTRCRSQRLVISPQHADFPSLLAEALDALAANQWQTAGTAEQLGCSTSQLVRLLRRVPEALDELNRHRAAAGAKRLH